MLFALSVQYARTYSLAREAVRLEQHRLDLIAENQRLREEIRRLQTDDRYIERLAREQLGLVRPGEIELLIVPPGSSPTSGPARGKDAAVSDPAGGHHQSARTPTWAARMREFLKHLFGWLRV
jgi:Septum formation initiator